MNGVAVSVVRDEAVLSVRQSTTAMSAQLDLQEVSGFSIQGFGKYLASENALCRFERPPEGVKCNKWDGRPHEPGTARCCSRNAWNEALVIPTPHRTAPVLVHFVLAQNQSNTWKRGLRFNVTSTCNSPKCQAKIHATVQLMCTHTWPEELHVSISECQPTLSNDVVICPRVAACKRCSSTRMMNCSSYPCSPSLDHIRSVSAVEQK